ncbi:UPF0148 protein [Methanomicrobium sp. W14]|uniref:Sjogren's syndrome/scleroderma autoantigen 1 family protein n=1 Tax=Methanomicrobium sp. W14 TaxID=2817839 RepID=UPI001AE94318|nr:Sjogren's syndrome/scleroderma autoantigen 1 family protein [Methanomicrobium sp. W14]MBP2132137.1 UPF0148 protein [Methanomicrobium sp. W14]
MADSLLKGGKMLDKTCPECGSPLFTVKGDTFCVVCRENRTENKPAPKKSGTDGAEKKYEAHTEEKRQAKEPLCVSDSKLYDEVKSAVISLCRRAESESRPKDCLCLMKSVNEGIDALLKLEKM